MPRLNRAKIVITAFSSSLLSSTNFAILRCKILACSSLAMFALPSPNLGPWTACVAYAVSGTTTRTLNFQPRQPNDFCESRLPSFPSLPQIPSCLMAPRKPEPFYNSNSDPSVVADWLLANLRINTHSASTPCKTGKLVLTHLQ